MKSRFLTQSLLAFCMLSSQLLATQTELDPLVVSSDFRDTKLSKTIGGVSVVDSAKISEDNSNNFENIIARVANVNFTSGSSRAHFIQIRGIGERSQFTNFINPSVGIILDGIDLSQSALAITPFDLAQVEVLRGPQGTTFGANGLAGVINILSNAPTKEGEFHTEATFGNYAKEAFGIATGGTLVEDKLLGRLSVYTNQSDGFMKNSFLNKNDTSNLDELTIKGHLKWLVNEGHTIDLNYLHLDVENGYDDFTLDNSRTSHSDEPGSDEQKTDGFSLKSTYQLNPKMHLITAISGSNSDLEYGYDEDWSHDGEFAADLGPYSSKDNYIRDRKLYDFDMRMVSDKGGEIFGGRSAWSFGVYYKSFDEDLKRVYTYLPEPFKSSYEATNKAIYGQLDTKLNDKLTLISGLRVEAWEADYSDSDKLSIDTDEVLNGGKIGLKYQQADNLLYYMALSKGYKAGGVNPNSSLALNARDYDTEALYNLDLGVNSSHFDDTLTSRLNLFYGQREDQQVKSSLVKLRDDGSSEFIDYIANAAKTHYYGLESELNYTPTENLRLFTSLGLLKSEFDDYVDPNPDSFDANGRTPAQSPEYQYDVGFDYLFGEIVKFSADVEGKGSYYFSNRHDSKSSAYALINSSISIYDKGWGVSLWGRNLSDRDYETRAFGSFGNNPAKLYATETYTQKGDPKTYGLTLSYDY